MEQLLPNAQIEESLKDIVLNAADIHTQEPDQLNTLAHFPINGCLLC